MVPTGFLAPTPWQALGRWGQDAGLKVVEPQRGGQGARALENPRSPRGGCCLSSRKPGFWKVPSPKAFKSKNQFRRRNPSHTSPGPCSSGEAGSSHTQCAFTTGRAPAPVRRDLPTVWAPSPYRACSGLDSVTEEPGPLRLNVCNEVVRASVPSQRKRLHDSNDGFFSWKRNLAACPAGTGRPSGWQPTGTRPFPTARVDTALRGSEWHPSQPSPATFHLHVLTLRPGCSSSPAPPPPPVQVTSLLRSRLPHRCPRLGSVPQATCTQLPV